MSIDSKYIETYSKNGTTYRVVRCYYKDKDGKTVYADKPGMVTDHCPFCDARTESGSWMPERCSVCSAVYFLGCWFDH